MLCNATIIAIKLLGHNKLCKKKKEENLRPHLFLGFNCSVHKIKNKDLTSSSVTLYKEPEHPSQDLIFWGLEIARKVTIIHFYQTCIVNKFLKIT